MKSKNVLVTGELGMSKQLNDLLNSKDGIKSSMISLFGDGWKQKDLSSFDTVVHVVGVVPKDGIKKEDYYNVNSTLTEEFAKKAKSEGVKHFVFLSSMAVYGVEPETNTQKGVVDENTLPNPKTDYGKSKLMAENALNKLACDGFKTAYVRVPSVFSKERREYLDQYAYLNKKFAFLPNAFRKNYKSFISIENLCELLYLTVKNEKEGIICPDEGEFSAYDICKAIDKNKKSSRLLGLVFTAFKGNSRIKDYFGACCYTKNLTEVFNGEYRKVKFNEAVKNCYEK